jgi:hypothetical protein
MEMKATQQNNDVFIESEHQVPHRGNRKMHIAKTSNDIVSSLTFLFKNMTDISHTIYFDLCKQQTSETKTLLNETSFYSKCLGF